MRSNRGCGNRVVRVLLTVVLALVLSASWALAAEIDDLPADVRSYLEPVHPWGQPDEIDPGGTGES